MVFSVQIPDDATQRLSAAGGDLPRRALEALVAEEYKQGRLTIPDLRGLLGFETGDQVDGFLKVHDVRIDYTMEDLERERIGLKRLGFRCAWLSWTSALFATRSGSVRLTFCRSYSKGYFCPRQS
jgi:hypothetical protein